MKNIIIRCLLSVSIACSSMALARNGSAVSSDYRMVGLAMHQETGRNIYLGAIHLGKDVPNPDNFAASAPPRLMEYRVTARRTSIRSLLGKMLLQSEVANGSAPGPEVVTFADSLLSAVKGSLYSGDSFQILQDANRQITASLNGAVLVRSKDAGVFDYLLMGWLGESGPSTTFRERIMRIDIDSSMLFAYEAHTPSAERLALVTGWAKPLPDPEPKAAPATSTIATVDEELVDENETASAAVAVISTVSGSPGPMKSLTVSSTIYKPSRSGTK